MNQRCSDPASLVTSHRYQIHGLVEDGRVLKSRLGSYCEYFKVKTFRDKKGIGGWKDDRRSMDIVESRPQLASLYSILKCTNWWQKGLFLATIGLTDLTAATPRFLLKFVFIYNCIVLLICITFHFNMPQQGSRNVM